MSKPTEIDFRDGTMDESRVSRPPEAPSVLFRHPEEPFLVVPPRVIHPAVLANE